LKASKKQKFFFLFLLIQNIQALNRFYQALGENCLMAPEGSEVANTFYANIM